MGRVTIYDTRSVHLRVEGEAPHRTPGGRSPIDPCGLDVEYSVDRDGSVKWAYVRLRGYKLDRDGQRLRGERAMTRRLGLVPGNEPVPAWRRRDVADLPAWVQAEVELYWPRWRPEE